MLRFIVNFFLFGFLFYLIYLFFPETFNTLVSWAQKVYEFFHDIYLHAADKWHSYRGGNPEHPRVLMESLWVFLKSL